MRRIWLLLSIAVALTVAAGSAAPAPSMVRVDVASASASDAARTLPTSLALDVAPVAPAAATPAAPAVPARPVAPPEPAPPSAVVRAVPEAVAPPAPAPSPLVMATERATIVTEPDVVVDTPSSGPPSSLAFTGSGPVWLLALALLVVVLGVVAIEVGRHGERAVVPAHARRVRRRGARRGTGPAHARTSAAESHRSDPRNR